jgi:hypothetical protein
MSYELQPSLDSGNSEVEGKLYYFLLPQLAARNSPRLPAADLARWF